MAFFTESKSLVTGRVAGSNDGAQDYRERKGWKLRSERRMKRGQDSWISASFDIVPRVYQEWLLKNEYKVGLFPLEVIEPPDFWNSLSGYFGGKGKKSYLVVLDLNFPFRVIKQKFQEGICLPNLCFSRTL